MRVWVIPVCARRMRQALAVALEPELHLVVELADMFVPGQRGEVFIPRRLAGLPVRLRQDPQVDVIGVTAIWIGLWEHVQSVCVQVGDVRAMYAVDVAL